MSREPYVTSDPIAAENLAFLGRTNAALSHELRNILAIISETAGLLDDLVELTEEGHPPRPGRLQELSSIIVEEAQRCNLALDHMNAFAHIVDEPVTGVALEDMVGLMFNLSRTLTPSKNIAMHLGDLDPCVMRTNPVVLQNLIQRCFLAAFAAIGPERDLTVLLRAGDGRAQVVFQGLTESGGEDESLTGQLAASVGASLERAGGELRLVLPLDDLA
jgi:signal transduction histidine kinase